MKSKYILIELSDKNEFRLNATIIINSLNINLDDVNIKIDTGCGYTSIPVQKLGISESSAQVLKEKDCNDKSIKKHVSFGVNDTQQERLQAKLHFKMGNYSNLKQVTFEHSDLELILEGINIKSRARISYDRTGNILLGMDILSQFDIHIGESKVLNKTILLACPKDQLNNDYFKALHEHFDLGLGIIESLL